MVGYYVKRALLGSALIVGLLIITYVLVYIAPGDPARVWAGKPRGPKAAEAIELARKELGLDKPLHIQIVSFIARFFTGNWGVSVTFKQPAADVVLKSFKATAELLLFSYIIAIPLGLILGISMALKRGGKVDLLLKLASSMFISIPRFWLALIVLFVFHLIGFQPLGRIDPRYSVEFREATGFYLLDSLLILRLDIFLDVLVRLVAPSLIIAVYPAFSIAKYVRYTLSERLYEDYVFEAISLGISRTSVLTKYALRGVIPAVVQLAGINFVYSFVETAVVELVFMREGIGKILVDGILRSDYPLIIAAFFMVSLILVVVNTVADVLQKRLDPRVTI
ncbi:MAG: ABC transporter permease [Sulfolobales archaeon]